MKKNIVFILAMVLSVAAFSQAKFGHIDSQVLLESMPERDAALEQVNKFAEGMQNKLQTMSVEFDQKLASYQQASATMTQTERETSEMELQDLQQRIQKFQVTAQEKIQQQQQELTAPIIDKVKAAIEKVSADNNFTYVFDSSTGATVFNGGEDILPLVKKELGIE